MMRKFFFALLLLAVGASAQVNTFRSCNALKTASPNLVSGVYTLTDQNGFNYQTYCEMTANNGGWTLVATIHENNGHPNGYCTVGDRWSSEQQLSAYQPKADTWMNLRTFGDVVSATDDDFKNAGYFDISANNLMVWQVPNGTPLQSWSTNAYLKYRTNNNFFANYGGNLYTLFKDYFPIVSYQYFWPADHGPAVPVVFDKGNGNDVTSLMAPSVVPTITSGYIQFRALNVERNAYAMCPGVKIGSTTQNAEHVCIGSAGWNAAAGYCGDFAGQAVSGYGTGVVWSSSKQLIESTYMLFYR